MPAKKTPKKKAKPAEEAAIHEFVKKDIGDPPKKVVKKKKAVKKKTTPKKQKSAEAALPEPTTSIEFYDENDQPIAVDQKKIDKQLTEIYENQDGSMPDMTTIEKKHRGRLVRAFFTLLFACAFLGGVAWLGFFVIQPQSGFSEEDVIVSISGEEHIHIGQQVRYRIRYRNAQSTSLAQAVLQVRYPEGFVFEESSVEPTNGKNDEWSLGTIKGQDSGFIDVFGTMYGDLGKRQSFRVFLNYLPANFSSEFQKVAHVTTEIESTPVKVSVTGPEDVAYGAETTYEVTVSKDGDIAVATLALELEHGAFRKTDSEPASDQFEETRWTLGSFEEETKVSITGAFNGEGEYDRAPLAVRVIGWKDESGREDPFVLATTSLDVAVLRTELSAQLVMNGSSADFDVQPGERLNTSIAIKNVGQSTFENMRVRLVFETPSAKNKSMLYWQDIDDPADGNIVGEQVNKDRRRGLVTWDKTHVTALRSLSPGDSALIDMSIPIKTMDQADLTAFASGAITAFLEVRYDVDDKQESLSTTPLTMTVNSDLAFEVRDDVREDAQGRDVHIINYVLTNQFHGLENVELTADVYGDVTWDESLLQVPAGDLTWDADAKKITWKIPLLPAEVDTVSLQFGLLMNSDNPTQTRLTSKPQLVATDSVTGRQLVKIGNEIVLNGGE